MEYRYPPFIQESESKQNESNLQNQIKSEKEQQNKTKTHKEYNSPSSFYWIQFQLQIINTILYFLELSFFDISREILTPVVADPKWDVIYKIGAISSGEILHEKAF